MAEFRTIVLSADEAPDGAHLNEVVDVANFAAVLTNNVVTTAVTDAQTKHPGDTILVRSYRDHSADPWTGGKEDLAGSRYYVPTEIEFYNEHGTKLTTIAPVVRVGDTLGDAVFDGFEKVFLTSPAIRDGRSQTLTVSDNITSAFTATLESDVETLMIPRPGEPHMRIPINVQEVSIRAGQGGRAVGTSVTGNVSAAATLSTIAGTGTAPSFQYSAKTQNLAVAFTIQAAL